MKVKAVVAFLFLCGIASAQQTATVTDTDGQTFNNGLYSAALISPNGPPTVNRVPVTTTLVQGSLSASGGLSVTLTPTNTLDQSGACWQFVITPNASNGGGSICIPVTSTTQNLSTILSAAVKAPRFPAGLTAYGYLDAEVQPLPPFNGATYYNVTTPCFRQFSLAGWTCGSGSGGGASFTPTGIQYATSATAATVATSSQIQSAIGSGVYATPASVTAAQAAAIAASDPVGSAATAQTAAIASAVSTGLQKASNLSDVVNVATARTNLGLGTAATTAATAYDAAGSATAAQAAAIASANATSANANNLTSGSVLPQLSAPVASTAVPSAEWPMDDYTGTTARDISGNGNTATLNGATWSVGAGINCFPTVGAAGQAVTTPLTGWGTIMIAFAPWNNGGNSTATPLNASSGPANVNQTIWGPTGGTGGIALLNAQTTSMGMLMESLRLAPSAGATFVSSNGFGGLHVMTYEVGSGVDAAFMDGIPIPGTSGGSSLAEVPVTGGTYQFCGVGTAASNAYRGTVFYAKAWPVGTVLTTQQIQQETNRMLSIVKNRPSIPQYPMNPNRIPTVVFVGDSLYDGYPGSGWANSTYVTPTNAYTLTNTGIFGVTARDLNWNAAHWLQAISPGGGKNYCFIDPGSNDINAHETAADILSSVEQIAWTARANGCIPILQTVISRGSGNDTNISPLDILERAQAVQSGAFAALDDVAELPVFSPNGTNNTNTACYFADDIHLLGPGAGSCYGGVAAYNQFGIAATRLINTLDGSTDVQPDLITSNAFVETDANNVMIHTPTAVATNQLPDCSFITGRKKTVTNQSLFAITMTTTSSQTITGNAVIAAGGKASYTATVTSPTAGGCYWLQQ